MCLNFWTPYDKNNDSNDKNNDSTGFWLLQCQNIIVFMFSVTILILNFYTLLA